MHYGVKSPLQLHFPSLKLTPFQPILINYTITDDKTWKTSIEYDNNPLL